MDWKILVVEDEQGMRSFYQAFFKLRGFSIECASSVDEAIAYTEEHPIKLVVLDLAMPDRNGEEFFDYVSNLHPQTFIIVATGYPTPSMLRKIAAKDNARLFVKPFSVDDVCAEAIAILSNIAPEAQVC